jgi:hypothetical protein
MPFRDEDTEAIAWTLIVGRIDATRFLEHVWELMNSQWAGNALQGTHCSIILFIVQGLYASLSHSLLFFFFSLGAAVGSNKRVAVDVLLYGLQNRLSFLLKLLFIIIIIIIKFYPLDHMAY